MKEESKSAPIQLAHTVHDFLVKLRAVDSGISGILIRHKLIRVPRSSRSSTTSRFDFSIRLLTQCTVYRREDFTVGTLAYGLFDCQISMFQVRYMGVGNFSTIVPLAGTTSQ